MTGRVGSLRGSCFSNTVDQFHFLKPVFRFLRMFGVSLDHSAAVAPRAELGPSHMTDVRAPGENRHFSF